MKQYNTIIKEFNYLKTEYNFSIDKKYWAYRRYYVLWEKKDIQIYIGYSNNKDLSPVIDILGPGIRIKYNEKQNVSKYEPISRLIAASDWLRQYMFNNYALFK